MKGYKKPNMTGDKNPSKRPEVREKIRIAKLKSNPGAYKKGERRGKKTEFGKGHSGYWNGKKRSQETKDKMSISAKMNNNSNWKGGKSFEPYTVNWSNTLKRSIRERDKYRCKICGEEQGERALDIHHIDYKKENCDPKNLISLCMKCHRKTNFNRDKWIKYFNENFN